MFTSSPSAKAREVLFQDAVQRDPVTARRAALLDLLWNERYLTREQLIARVELRLGKACFGKAAWEDNFYRDMRVVKQAFERAGFHLAFSRGKLRAGYYLQDQPTVSQEYKRIISGASSEVDQRQIDIYHRLSPMERFRQGCAISDAARNAVAYRIHQENPGISPAEGKPPGFAKGVLAMNPEVLDIVGFLKLVTGALQSAGVEYLIGGAIAGWAWGEPRATQDLDIVIDLPVEAVTRLSSALEARDMLVPPDVILDALLEDRADIPINAIHMYSGLKADLYPVRPGDDLRRAAFQRRAMVDFGPPIGSVYVHSPEDLILYKLLFFSISQQSKHIRDITAILRARKDRLDLGYIQKWTDRLGLSRIWQELLDTAGDV